MSTSAIGLLLRLVVDLVMMGHGAQKVLGWFGVPGWTSFAETLSAGWPWSALLSPLLSLCCLITFLKWEQRMSRRGKTALVELSLLRHPRFSAGLLTIGLASALFAAVLFLLAFYLQTILHFTPLQAGLVIMAASLSFFLASLLSPMVAPRLDKRSLLMAAMLITLGYALVSLSAQWLVPVWGISPFLGALFVLGLGMGSLSAPLLTKTLEGVAPNAAGAASGVYTTVSQVAGALGVTFIGLLDAFLLVSRGNPLPAFVFSMLAISLLSLGLSFCVLPLTRLLAPRAERETLDTLPQEGAEPIQ